MKRFIVKRMLSIIPVLFIVSIVVFMLVHLVPGDPAASMLGDMASQEDIAALHARLGLDRPLPVQYGIWLKNVLTGYFGESVANHQPVTGMILSHLEPTIHLTLLALLIAVMVAIPLGMIGATNKGTAADHSVTVISLLGISLPGFLLGLFLILIFAVKLKLLPSSGYAGMNAGFAAHIKSILLPAIALGFMNAALMMRMTRASMLEVLNSDYIRMARAKGVSGFSVITRHAFKNTLVTVITVISQALIQSLSGAAVIESLFAIPGLGQLMVNSIGRRDYYVIQAIVLLIAVFNVVINMFADLLYGVVDPRVRVG
ncbi:peptide ABC transporter [Oribacterium sp. C9]|uniref:ABC transporter permease n=1 Tax=Oribacterium sp. C9 TaxID=1943579 RepID=UPI00098FFA55|nr:ABC transporter permease [Oribacterium sp. C9]OON88047.1 peptide ABC transporter [Oribacterium sp. C9]